MVTSEQHYLTSHHFHLYLTDIQCWNINSTRIHNHIYYTCTSHLLTQERLVLDRVLHISSCYNRNNPVVCLSPDSAKWTLLYLIHVGMFVCEVACKCTDCLSFQIITLTGRSIYIPAFRRALVESFGVEWRRQEKIFPFGLDAVVMY